MAVPSPARDASAEYVAWGNSSIVRSVGSIVVDPVNINKNIIESFIHHFAPLNDDRSCFNVVS